MSIELTARTEPGKRLVALAETLANEIGPQAGTHDRDGSFPFDSFATVKTSGYFTAPIPEQLGGLDVTSVHDVVVASSRLARGDASLTLGVNMHLVYVLNVVRRWQIAVASGNERRAGAFAETLEADRPRRNRVRVRRQRAGARPHSARDDRYPHRDGWIVSGHKVFCTMSPAADVLYTAVTFADDAANERYGYAMVARDARSGRPPRLGRARHARLRQQLRLVRGRAAPGLCPPRRLPCRRLGRVHGAESRRRPLPRGRRTRHRRERARERHRRLARATELDPHACSPPRTSSISPPAAPSSRGQPP